jgi:histidinol phosphatase-like enzyme
MTIFLDLDTVLLAQHSGRYGPELGVQADLPAALDRMAEIADRIVVLVNPPSRGTGHAMETDSRVDLLRARLGDKADRLIVATCPHGDDYACTCAKPGHGLIDQYLDDGGRRGRNGWYVGGDQEGMVAGRGAGLRTIRIGPHGEDHLSTVHRPDYEARDLLDAANHVLIEELAAS